jgi:hypothetical protein
VPAAELFGMWAVAEAARDATGRCPTSVTAVGDCCDPAAGALNSVASRNPQMRGLLAGARQLTQQWLAISIPREYNLDADRLSHPAKFEDVKADAAAAGLIVHVAPIPDRCWEALLAVTREAAGGEGEAGGGARRRRRKPRRRAGWGAVSTEGERDSPQA